MGQTATKLVNSFSFSKGDEDNGDIGSNLVRFKGALPLIYSRRG